MGIRTGTLIFGLLFLFIFASGRIIANEPSTKGENLDLSSFLHSKHKHLKIKVMPVTSETSGPVSQEMMDITTTHAYLIEIPCNFMSEAIATKLSSYKFITSRHEIINIRYRFEFSDGKKQKVIFYADKFGHIQKRGERKILEQEELGDNWLLSIFQEISTHLLCLECFLESRDIHDK